jgi:hypothetical protein
MEIRDKKPEDLDIKDSLVFEKANPGKRSKSARSWLH